MKCNWNLLAAFCFKILTLTHNSCPTYKRLNRQNLCLKQHLQLKQSRAYTRRAFRKRSNAVLALVELSIAIQRCVVQNPSLLLICLASSEQDL